MDKLNFFCTHIRAALACYVDMTPEQQGRALLYAERKINALDALHTAAQAPGGAMAGELLQKMQQSGAIKQSDGTHQKE